MNIKIIIFNIILIVFLFSLIYLYLYINYSYEGFELDEDTIESNALNQSGTLKRIEPKLDEIDRDGSTADTAIQSRILPYLNYSREGRNLNKLGDNYYWITLPNIGDRYIYCIMDTKYYGGGWMLAMRGVRGSKTFGYYTNYWTTNNTLNADYNDITRIISNTNLSVSSIGEKIYGNYENNPTEYGKLDAKFETFNRYPASEWMAIFYHKIDTKDHRGVVVNTTYYKGGDSIDGIQPENTKGWIWKENYVSIKRGELIPPVALFSNRSKLSPYSSLVNLTQKYNVPNAKSLQKFYLKPDRFPQLWSSQGAYNFYGINYEVPSHGSSKSNVRWGFAWNENPGNPNDTNDVYGGIGTGYRGGYSAGDFIDCCQDVTGVNSSIAFEWYVR